MFRMKIRMTRTHQIHIFEENNLNDIERHLAVRDYLRIHTYDAFKYGELKSKLFKYILQEEFWHDYFANTTLVPEGNTKR